VYHTQTIDLHLPFKQNLVVKPIIPLLVFPSCPSPKYLGNQRTKKRGQYNACHPSPTSLLVKSLCQTPLFFIPSLI
jgi:hypothetical protein